MDCLVEIRTALADGLESLEPEDRVLRKIVDWEVLPRVGDEIDFYASPDGARVERVMFVAAGRGILQSGMARIFAVYQKGPMSADVLEEAKGHGWVRELTDLEAVADLIVDW
ncbi:MAG TPA: hypothetical protein VJ787_05855 [Thermoleophilia bacterium]|nr:hypothetical protein [Thermoleophilia bacterium]